MAPVHSPKGADVVSAVTQLCSPGSPDVLPTSTMLVIRPLESIVNFTATMVPEGADFLLSTKILFQRPWTALIMF